MLVGRSYSSWGLTMMGVVDAGRLCPPRRSKLCRAAPKSARSDNWQAVCFVADRADNRWLRSVLPMNHITTCYYRSTDQNNWSSRIEAFGQDAEAWTRGTMKNIQLLIVKSSPKIYRESVCQRPLIAKYRDIGSRDCHVKKRIITNVWNILRNNFILKCNTKFD